MLTAAKLAPLVHDARERLLDLLRDLDDQELHPPFLQTVNPLLWEACHAAYFQEYWVLRRGAGQEPDLSNADVLFDSITVEHETRWRLPLPDRARALAYLDAVRERTLELLERRDEPELNYLVLYAVLHEDMHTEALTATRQSLGYPAPSMGVPRERRPATDPVTGDASHSGGVHLLGAPRDADFCFDNEKWAHPVEVAPFAIARAAVTEGEFLAFVEDEGYGRSELWTPQGWSWRLAVQAEQPLFWRRRESTWERRVFDAWQPLQPTTAMSHVSWYEADAWCRWKGRRLPTEVEWEMAATAVESSPALERCSAANLDWRLPGPCDAAAHADGDAASGCRQMRGNVWEWTATTFAPYPEFVADMYADYSQTSFHTRKVLRGGCWATRSRLASTTYRNYYPAGRRENCSGFRTCPL